MLDIHQEKGLTYINRTAEETAAAIDAWNKLGEKMNLAMRNNLGAGTYTSIESVTDPSVATDTQFPYCVEVESAIDSMIQIVQDILANGTGAVDSVGINASKPNNWDPSTPYSNYNIIGDPLLPDGECDDVVSSLDSLYDNVVDVLDEQLVAKTLRPMLTEKIKPSKCIGKMAKLTQKKTKIYS